ncbi:hypothetical protein SGGMMB4_02647 [Sodalis glossinidius str. 'morsitans']|uniref:Uncharacterized protein n=1 Tax=Sodalis glossinidius (strain morsitans) TaxID=343509 RepID=A0A193QIV3_SODGM|nr:hypothetical protein [Sodalis glossinidius]CRL43706.1 hypothetical protein SGGMMB4_00211 [Sodalis glossinidius str. 'morsitans']CRL45087.1 hypothetical protein SGGMMB4_02609 [Sodalis glossinidius str. 'morsitans']CRL45112.1 hypothetical protein SGGMMB4_02647 [Sodalis glossinidius str. 'morsitans']
MNIEKPSMTIVPFANANCNAWDFGNGNVVYDFLTADRMAKPSPNTSTGALARAINDGKA